MRRWDRVSLQAVRPPFLQQSGSSYLRLALARCWGWRAQVHAEAPAQPQKRCPRREALVQSKS